LPVSSPLRAPSHADPSGLGHAATIYSSVQGPPGVETPTYIYILLIKAVRGRLPFRVLSFPFPFPALSFSFSPLRKAHFHSRLPFRVLPVFCHSHYPLPTLSFSFPIPANLIPIPTCISGLTKIKLKNTNVAPMGFEPATSQANMLVATTTPHVCLCQYLL
jgi:hypothetical protein